VRSQQLAAQGKALRVELDTVAFTVWADAAKLRSVIDNLIGNAIKFTPAGGEILVRARQIGALTTIDVMDSGPGVPPEEREAIFEAFFRGRAGAFGRAEGTGLGLAIAREFTEAHGGRIEIVAGTRGGHFRVTLPLRPAVLMAEAA
jgi:two-component system sensor histidine kinase GlrK